MSVQESLEVEQVIKIKYHGVKLRCRVIPKDSDEVIKDNFMYLKGQSDLSFIKQDQGYLSFIKQGDYAFTEVAGDRTSQHSGRQYVEVLSKFMLSSLK